MTATLKHSAHVLRQVLAAKPAEPTTSVQANAYKSRLGWAAMQHENNIFEHHLTLPGWGYGPSHNNSRLNLGNLIQDGMMAKVGLGQSFSAIPYRYNSTLLGLSAAFDRFKDILTLSQVKPADSQVAQAEIKDLLTKALSLKQQSSLSSQLEARRTLAQVKAVYDKQVLTPQLLTASRLDLVDNLHNFISHKHAIEGVLPEAHPLRQRLNKLIGHTTIQNKLNTLRPYLSHIQKPGSPLPLPYQHQTGDILRFFKMLITQ